MILAFNDHVSSILERVRRSSPANSSIFLVGGAVRDLLLGMTSGDLDFVIDGNAIQLAKQTADQLGGAFYILDHERDTARVLLNLPDQKRLILDFARMRGNSLEADLAMRDFTINAMAIDIRHPERLLDPMSGARNLKDKRLIACTPTSFQDDPLRVLRAVRMSTSFSLRIDLPTQIALKNAVTGLEKISGERIRDELFKLMESRNIERSLRIADRLGIIKYLLPELDRLKRVPQPLPHQLDAWDHTLQTVGQVERLLSVIAGEYHPDQANELRLGLAVLYLGRFRERLTQRYQKSVTPPRSIKSLLLLAGLYHDSGKADTLTRDFDATIHFYRHEKRSVEILSERARQLSLSNLETSLVSTIIGNHMRPHQLSNDLEVLSNRAIYRYFRATGDAGIDICILTLADTLATYGVTLPQDVWTKELKTCQQILNAYFDTPELTVNPIRLVTGDDLIKEFQLFPGPLIGELLEFIREAQASGEIMTRQDAFDLVKQRLRSHL